MDSMTFFTIRLFRATSLESIKPFIHSSFETENFGADLPKHMSNMYELNVWTAFPETFKGWIADFNYQFPGLSIGIVSSHK